MQNAQAQQRDRSDQLIATAIASAETRSAAEIAVAIVPRADHYRLTAVLAAVSLYAFLDMIFNAARSSLIVWLAPMIGADTMTWLGPVIAIVLAILLFFACEHTALGVRLTPVAARRRACLARTRLLFLDHGIDATQDRLGLLICVCEAERQIEILPDRGIAAIIPETRWQDLIEAFRGHKQAGPLDTALVHLIAAAADELAPRFPPWPDQRNELPDRPFRS